MEKLLFEFEKQFNQLVSEVEKGTKTLEDIKALVSDYLAKSKVELEADILQAKADAAFNEWHRGD